MNDGSVLAPSHRALTVGVTLCVTIAAFQGVGVVTILPRVARELGGLSSYGWGVAAFTLAAVVGTVIAGRDADRHGLARPLVAGAVLFALGSATCAAAPGWAVLLAGRALQGLGEGAIAAAAYTTVGRAYPDELRPQMLALMSTAWVLPSLIGPVAAGALADAGHWRVVFVALVPILAAAAFFALPQLRRVPVPAEPQTTPGLVRAALAAALGLGLVLGGLGLRSPLGIALAIAGVVVAAPALRRVLPRGTLRLRPGVGLGVASRGLLAGAFLGVEAFVTLGLAREREWPAVQIGLAITAASLSWTAGSWLQARLDGRSGPAGRPKRMVAGFALLAASIALTGIGVLVGGLPGIVVPIGWAIGGLGIGMAYSTAASTAYAATPSGAEGRVSASLQVVETAAVSVVTGAGTAIVALGLDRGWSPAAVLGPVYAGCVLLALLGLLRWARAVRLE